MNTKLTLTVEKAVIEKAKAYAKNTGRSLSDVIESYLETLVAEEPTTEMLSLSPKIKKISGVVKLPKDFNEKKEIAEYLKKKHL